MNKALHWFRADLRVGDNAALCAAANHSDCLIGIVILTPKTWARHHAAPCKIQFMLEHIKVLSEQLMQKNIPLLIRVTDYFSQCPQVLLKICQEYQIDAVFFNQQYEYDEIKRDERVISLLSQHKINVYPHHDQLIVPPGRVLSNAGTPFKIFTPFKTQWLKQVTNDRSMRQEFVSPKPNPDRVFSADSLPSHLDYPLSRINNQLPIGEQAAQQQLILFCRDKLKQYHLTRDFPALEGTSCLSAYLAQGILSPRQCINTMLDYLAVDCVADLPAPGAQVWLSELIWREFYKHLVYFFPAVCRGEPFKQQTQYLPWHRPAWPFAASDTIEAPDQHTVQFIAWCKGMTGFPLVDAAMRQLNQTGWMHNRLRMVTAVFLTKILFIDWRLGERYFMEHLIDGDFAANNGGWQWSASTGTDAVPYFRIFNPFTQGERFDPDVKFIKLYCPELDKLDAQTIHHIANHKIQPNYPQPIVDYGTARLRTIAQFKQAAN